MWIDEERFAALVTEALDGLPETIRAWLDNVEVVSADWPSARHLAMTGAAAGETLFGLYEGVPRTGRSASYGMVLPDKITIFRGPIAAASRSERELRSRVRHTVIHELAHHFGIDDERLRQIGAY